MLHALNLRKLITSILIPVAVGGLAGFLTRNSMNIYGEINTPPLSPPGIVFPIVWTILYVLMGISLYLVRDSKADAKLKSKGYLAFGLQLAFNFLWSIVFFNFRWYLFAAIWLLALIVLIALNIFYFAEANRAAGLLLVPYLLWCAFALYLNIGIFILN